MRNSDYSKFIGFMMITLILLFAGFFLTTFPLSFILGNELGDIYWGIILPIIAFIVLIIFLVALTSYLASWIYFAKLKGYSRWFGIMGLIPVIGPLFLVLMKRKVPQEEEGIHVMTTGFIGMIIPIVIIFATFSITSAIKKEMDILIKDNYISQSKINAAVKGIFHEKK